MALRCCSKAADLGQYAFAPSWTPMGPMGAMGAMDYGAQWPAPRPVGYTGRTAAAAKAALEMFQPPGHEMRQRAEEAAMATKQRRSWQLELSLERLEIMAFRCFYTIVIIYYIDI